MLGVQCLSRMTEVVSGTQLRQGAAQLAVGLGGRVNNNNFIRSSQKIFEVEQ